MQKYTTIIDNFVSTPPSHWLRLQYEFNIQCCPKKHHEFHQLKQHTNTHKTYFVCDCWMRCKERHIEIDCVFVCIFTHLRAQCAEWKKIIKYKNTFIYFYTFIWIELFLNGLFASSFVIFFCLSSLGELFCTWCPSFNCVAQLMLIFECVCVSHTHTYAEREFDVFPFFRLNESVCCAGVCAREPGNALCLGGSLSHSCTCFPPRHEWSKIRNSMARCAVCCEQGSLAC